MEPNKVNIWTKVHVLLCSLEVRCTGLKKWCFQLLTYTGPSLGPLPSPASPGEDGREVWEADGDLTGVGEGDMSNSSSWWYDASSDGRCGGVGLGGAFFLKEDFFAGFLGDLFTLPRPRPLPAIRRIWWDWSKGMISIYNAVVDCRDTVEELWERRLPTSFIPCHEIANQTLGYRYSVVCTLTNR